MAAGRNTGAGTRFGAFRVLRCPAVSCTLSAHRQQQRVDLHVRRHGVVEVAGIEPW
jgi:hypothetical protein